MINVLYIGNYDKNGRFTDVKWNILLRWLSNNCNNIRIYTEQNMNQISKYFSKYSEIIEETSPDPYLNYNGYRNH
ncbi:MAG: hypothetical protein GX359_03800 [Clostridiales bacterium]|nr:hypothetical protein [Clostridiales bacterium]